MTFLTVRHVTAYTYKQAVAFGEHRVMFRPRDSYDQRLLHASLLIDPEPVALHWTHDVFGNCVAVAHFAGRWTRLRFESVIEVEHTVLPMQAFPVAPPAETYPFCYDQEDMPDLLRSIERKYPDRNQELAGWARSFTEAGPVRTTELLAGITQTIRREFTYVRREAMGVQTPLETLRLRSGSCRDFALLMMEALRALGFAARFVTGYLHSRSSNVGGGATHAWVQVFVPGAGWIEYDPTNGIEGSHDLIRVAVARDPEQAVPLWGTWSGYPGSSLGLQVAVSVTASDRPRGRAEGAGAPAPGMVSASVG